MWRADACPSRYRSHWLAGWGMGRGRPGSPRQGPADQGRVLGAPGRGGWPSPWWGWGSGVTMRLQGRSYLPLPTDSVAWLPDPWPVR